jgi:hypothetical protein
LHYYAFYKDNNNINIIKVSSDFILVNREKGAKGLRVIKGAEG